MFFEFCILPSTSNSFFSCSYWVYLKINNKTTATHLKINIVLQMYDELLKSEDRYFSLFCNTYYTIQYHYWFDSNKPSIRYLFALRILWLSRSFQISTSLELCFHLSNLLGSLPVSLNSFMLFYVPNFFLVEGLLPLSTSWKIFKFLYNNYYRFMSSNSLIFWFLSIC